MSLVRVGMSENKKYGDGFDAIFGKKKTAAKKPAAKKDKKKKK
jgi:CDGSH-type Zn-finger protein